MMEFVKTYETELKNYDHTLFTNPRHPFLQKLGSAALFRTFSAPDKLKELWAELHPLIRVAQDSTASFS